MTPRFPLIKPLVDWTVTFLLWAHFTAGFVVLFAPRYLWARLRSGDCEAAFQRLNHLYFRSFFRLLLRITPGLTLRVGGDVRRLRSAVIIGNHLSYLDPILLISLFEKQKTIVKSVFFRVPIFGWVLRRSGYIPSTSGEDYASLMIRNIEHIRDYLDSGGNLFIFPEGTRSRTGRLGPFSKGAFSIARYCRAPIACVRIRHTDRLFIPGRFRFNTCVPNTVSLELIGMFNPEYGDPTFRLADLIREVRALYDAQPSADSD
jgi:1-acyl-sn-glycerol-3-phosphate acyltransferase